eukprot:5698570-Prorocentrum_lima.AAC.1
MASVVGCMWRRLQIWSRLDGRFVKCATRASRRASNLCWALKWGEVIIQDVWTAVCYAGLPFLASEEVVRNGVGATLGEAR